MIAHWDGAHMHIDHVTPRSKGGSDDVHNLRIAHPACNLKKGDRELSARRMKAILKELQKTDEEIKKGFLF
jgi:5-methylcytosine-specific restriction endonuclease McrA